MTWREELVSNDAFSTRIWNIFWLCSSKFSY